MKAGDVATDSCSDDPLGAGRPSTGTRSGTVVCADNLPWMRELGDGCCDLIYADPPFTVEAAPAAESRRKSRSAGGHPAPPHAEIAFLRPRLAQMHRLLSARGCLYVHLDWRTVHYVKIMLDELFGAGNFLNEIVWSYRSGARPARWFPRKHDTLLLYAKCAGEHTFNRLRGGGYRTRDLRVSADGRPYKSTTGGPLYFHPDGPAVSDVWDIPFLSTVSDERTGWPGQKPEALVERLIRASSNPGDLVADFFCGSGTTLVAAKRLGRRWLGCDVSPEAVAIARRRLLSVTSTTLERKT